MPKLLVFAPCERVIIGDIKDNSASLIGVLQGFEAAVKPVESPQANQVAAPVIPFSWSVFALWYRLAGEESTTFTQRWQLAGPDGKVHVAAESSFQMTAPFHRQTHRLFGLPVSMNGVHWLRLAIKASDAPEDQYVEVGDFPMHLEVTSGPTA